jgi:hypothetical protein
MGFGGGRLKPIDGRDELGRDAVWDIRHPLNDVKTLSECCFTIAMGETASSHRLSAWRQYCRARACDLRAADCGVR